MALRADDGTVLEVKEAVVLDRDGNPLAVPSEEDTQDPRNPFEPHFKSRSNLTVFNLSGWLLPLGLIILFVLVAFSLFSLGAVFAVLLAIGFLHRFVLKMRSLLK